jgi:galactokinase
MKRPASFSGESGDPIMALIPQNREAFAKLSQLARQAGLDITGGKVRRTSSRFCLGVEHGDYNGTELFGVGTDRFIWLAYKRNGTDRSRFFSGNFPLDGVIEFKHGDIPAPKSAAIADTWGRFAYGVDFILKKEGYTISNGIDAVIYGNIPGGGMSRSASLTLNLMLSVLESNGIDIKDRFKVVDMAQAVENDYIGSPCGKLDQVMILFAKAEMGTHYNPATREVSHLPLGKNAPDFRFVGLDTGTERPGLEKSTYRIRRAECERLVSLLQESGFKIQNLADIKKEETYSCIKDQFGSRYPDLCDRLKYLYHAQKRFYAMLDAWKVGDIPTVGKIFRKDGIGLRDDYKISGPELEAMCDIARKVEGVYGERMLGGGDKGASGALVAAESVEALKRAVDNAYPRRYPELKDKYAVHIFKMVEGISVMRDSQV